MKKLFILASALILTVNFAIATPKNCCNAGKCTKECATSCKKGSCKDGKCTETCKNDTKACCKSANQQDSCCTKMKKPIK